MLQCLEFYSPTHKMGQVHLQSCVEMKSPCHCAPSLWFFLLPIEHIKCRLMSYLHRIFPCKWLKTNCHHKKKGGERNQGPHCEMGYLKRVAYFSELLFNRSDITTLHIDNFFFFFFMFIYSGFAKHTCFFFSNTMLHTHIVIHICI